jgi:hypothetical protein
MGFLTLVLVEGVGLSVLAIPTSPISTSTTVAALVELTRQTESTAKAAAFSNKVVLGLREVRVCSLPRHVRDPSKRRRFGPNKLHYYLIPVLTRARFGEGLMVIP